MAHPTHITGPLIMNGQGGAENDSVVLGIGTSTSPAVCDTASTNFKEFRFDCGATSGDARGEYLRLYITGAGGGGEALRAFTTVNDVAAANPNFILFIFEPPLEVKEADIASLIKNRGWERVDAVEKGRIALALEKDLPLTHSGPSFINNIRLLSEKLKEFGVLAT